MSLFVLKGFSLYVKILFNYYMFIFNKNYRYTYTYVTNIGYLHYLQNTKFLNKELFSNLNSSSYFLKSYNFLKSNEVLDNERLPILNNYKIFFINHIVLFFKNKVKFSILFFSRMFLFLFLVEISKFLQLTYKSFFKVKNFLMFFYKNLYFLGSKIFFKINSNLINGKYLY